jgi:phosphatidylglycerophosphate synthase
VKILRILDIKMIDLVYDGVFLLALLVAGAPWREAVFLTIFCEAFYQCTRCVVLMVIAAAMELDE